MKKCSSAMVLFAVLIFLLAGCSSEYKFKYNASAAFLTDEALNTYSFPSGLTVSYPAAYTEYDSGELHYFRPDSTNFAFTQYMEVGTYSAGLEEIKDNFVANLGDYKELGSFTFSISDELEGIGVYGNTTVSDTNLNVVSVLIPHNQYIDIINFSFVKEDAAFEKDVSKVINSLRSKSGGFNLLNDEGTDLSADYRANLELAWKGVDYRANYLEDAQAIVIVVSDADLSDPDRFINQAIISLPPIPIEERDRLESISLDFNRSNFIMSMTSEASAKTMFGHGFDESADYYDALEKAYAASPYFASDPLSSPKAAAEKPASSPDTLSDQQSETPFFEYSGSGDDVVTGLQVDNYAFLRVKNSGGGHFAVKAHHGDRYDLLVNTVAPYEGETLLLPYGEYTLEISASGAWTAEAFELGTSSSDTFVGTGDFVTPIFISSSDVYEIIAPGGRHFAVKGYYGDGRYDLLVNTTDDYSGKVMFKHEGDYCFFAVTGEREVTITPQ